MYCAVARLAEADGEIGFARDSGKYDHFVVNDVLDDTIEQIAGIIEADVVGSSGGRTIRRGLAYTLDIGVTRSLPAFRNGAYEFRGVAAHGGR